MENRTYIDRLPDELLIRILWHSSNPPSSYKSDSDALWSSLDLQPNYFYANSSAEKDGSQEDKAVLPIPPALADAAYNLLIASICRRWRLLARRYVSSLLVEKDRVVSLQDLSNSVSCFPSLTHLHLENDSVEALDDAFLAHLASACPKLTVLHVGYRITPFSYDARKHLHPITESGLDHFFRQCSQLQRLSLYCLHRDTQLPASFFLLTDLHTVVLTDASALESPDLVNLSSLATLHIASSKLTREQLSSLVRLSSLTSLSVSSRTTVHGSAAFAFSQLASLKSLEFGGFGPSFNILFPSAAPYKSLENLLISYCDQLERFPDDFGELLPSLRNLTIRECNNITHLPGSLASLSFLESLKISTCFLFEDLPGNLGQLPALKTLILDDLHLSNLPDSLCKLPSLKTLFLIHCCQIQQLPEAFSNLTSLETLCFMHSTQLVVPEDIGELTNLHTLALNESLVQPLPCSFTRLTSLTRLELDDCWIEVLPADIVKLTSLQELYIHDCPIRELPELVTALTSLEILSVGSCSQLSSVPSRLDALGRLKRLEVTKCGVLSNLPECLPPSLETLNFGTSSQVTAVPDFSVLPKLRKLRLNLDGIEQGLRFFNSLSHLTELELGLAEGAEELPLPLSSFPHLRILAISRAGKMKNLPENLGSDLQQLQQLRIRGAAELKDLPASITQLRHLTSLEIQHAPELSFLPDGLGALSRLRELRLCYCSSLEHLPDSFSQLACLNKLVVINCSIRCLPSHFAQLTRLRRLRLDGCKQLQGLPEGITELKKLHSLSVKDCEELTDTLDLDGFYGVWISAGSQSL
ncbi:hypothetical protein CLOM_g10368 [Closterium sp. NIES-68]|nr:hypothetical protein CLOM_g10368 [Closterium sp. NIES-68]GJP61303.1 hypothetical protein CLOP_g18475 [Closterium sp. NIES-67]